MCIDYRKLNSATTLPFIDEMLERLAKHSFFCFLDGYSGYHQIPIHPDDQSKTTSHALMERMHTEGCHLGFAMPLHRSKDA